MGYIRMVEMKIFGLYDANVKVEDVGLRRYIDLTPKLVVKSRGRARARFEKSKVNILERLANKMAVGSHRGKKHKIQKNTSGKFSKQVAVIIKAFSIIEKKTNQNPLQIFIRAIENVAPRDEVTIIEYGGARYPQAVDCSPQRRLDVALRFLVQSAYNRAFNKKVKVEEAFASEIIDASNHEGESVKRRHEMEKQADAAR